MRTELIISSCEVAVSMGVAETSAEFVEGKEISIVVREVAVG